VVVLGFGDVGLGVCVHFAFIHDYGMQNKIMNPIQVLFWSSFSFGIEFVEIETLTQKNMCPNPNRFSFKRSCTHFTDKYFNDKDERDTCFNEVKN
jgi:hypothetical protein